MIVRVEPSVAEGKLRAPPSKSWSQRALFLSLLAEGTSKIKRLPTSDDVLATLNAVKMFGAAVEVEKDMVKITGGQVATPEDVINMRGSGTGARIAIAVGTLVPKGTGAVITGNKSLRRRPMRPVIDIMRQLGAEVLSLREGKLPVVSLGGLPGGTAEVDGRVTSQHVTAALIAGTRSEKGVTVKARNLVSRGYVALTEEVLEEFGAEVECKSDYSECTVKPSELKPVEKEVPGDYALAAFPMVLAAVTGGKVEVEGLPSPRSGPGDHKILRYLEKFGVHVKYLGNKVLVEGSARPKGARVNLKDEPDLALPLAALAAVAKGESVLAGIAHLAYKESNRIKTIIETLECFGIKARVDGHSIRILGSESLRRCTIRCPDDHRIAMLASVLGAASGAIIEGAECVAKSWPEYWEAMSALGVKVYVEGEEGRRTHRR